LALSGKILLANTGKINYCPPPGKNPSDAHASATRPTVPLREIPGTGTYRIIWLILLGWRDKNSGEGGVTDRGERGRAAPAGKVNVKTGLPLVDILIFSNL